MAWKLFGKSKSKKEENPEPDEPVEELNDDIEIESDIEDIEQEEETEEGPLAEYSETLETGVSTSKKPKSKAPNDQRIWRDVSSIEEKVDNLHISRAEKPVTELDKTVDKLILKKKKK